MCALARVRGSGRASSRKVRCISVRLVLSIFFRFIILWTLIHAEAVASVLSDRIMNMRFKTTLLISVVAIGFAMTGCGSSEPTANLTNANVANTNTAPPSNGGLETNKKPEAVTTNDAPTLAPVVHAYYD